MTLRSAINGFLDKTVDARFKRDGEGRLVFYPMGYGSGRIVPVAETEATLRTGSRRLMIATFVVLVPLIAMVQALVPLKGLNFLFYFLGCGVLGFASQIYPMWLARGLPRSSERLSFLGAMTGSLDRFGQPFLLFGLWASGGMALAAAIFLAYPVAPDIADPVAMWIALLFFAPLTFVYALALRRKRDVSAV